MNIREMVENLRCLTFVIVYQLNWFMVYYLMCETEIRNGVKGFKNVLYFLPLFFSLTISELLHRKHRIFCWYSNIVSNFSKAIMATAVSVTSSILPQNLNFAENVLNSTLLANQSIRFIQFSSPNTYQIYMCEPAITRVRDFVTAVKAKVDLHHIR